MDKRKRVSIISCVLNEAQALPVFYEELQKVLGPLKERYDFELLFVNNRSTDATLDLLVELSKKDPSVQILTMSRNFGYQASLQAGFSNASGDASIVLDVDLEDPPELIPQFLEKWEEGFDVVYGIRTDRPEVWPIKKGRNLFYQVLRFTADMDIILYMAEFALISRTVRDAIINNRNTFPFFRAEMGYAGFSRHGIEYARRARKVGQTHYNYFGMFVFAVAGLLTSSTFLLRLAGYAFPIVAFLNLAALLFSPIFKGLFSIAVILDLVYGIFLLTIQGVYIARIYKNGMGRPVYLLDPKLTYKDSAKP